MAGPMDMMGGGPPPGMMGPPPGGEKTEPTVDDLITALKILPMEVRQQIAAEIVGGEEGAGGPPPSMEGPGPGGPLEDIAKARVGGLI